MGGPALSDINQQTGNTSEPSTSLAAIAEPSAPLELIAPLVAEPQVDQAVVAAEVGNIASVETPAAPEFEHHSEVATLLGDVAIDTAAQPGEAVAVVDPIGAVASPIIPDSYDIQPPAGFHVTDVDRQRMTAVFRDAGLTAEQGKKLAASFYNESIALQEALLATENRRQQDVFMATRRGWLDRIKGTPKTIEKDGKLVDNPNYVPPHEVLGQPGAIEAVVRMRDRIVPKSDSDGWKEMCGLTGAGDHPSLVLAVYRAHEDREKLIAEYEAKIVTAVASALEPYQESRAPAVRGKPVPHANVDPGLSGFQAFYAKQNR